MQATTGDIIHAPVSPWLHHSLSASIVQGSAIGSASYVVNGSDLHAVSVGNELCKYANDTQLIILAVNVDTGYRTRSAELNHIAEWALYN